MADIMTGDSRNSLFERRGAVEGRGEAVNAGRSGGLGHRRALSCPMDIRAPFPTGTMQQPVPIILDCPEAAR